MTDVEFVCMQSSSDTTAAPIAWLASVTSELWGVDAGMLIAHGSGQGHCSRALHHQLAWQLLMKLLLLVVMLVDNTNLSLVYSQNAACMLDAGISGVLTRGAEIDLKTPGKTKPHHSIHRKPTNTKTRAFPEHAVNLPRQQPWQRSAALMISKRCVPSHSIRNFRQQNMQIAASHQPRRPPQRVPT